MSHLKLRVYLFWITIARFKRLILPGCNFAVIQLHSCIVTQFPERKMMVSITLTWLLDLHAPSYYFAKLPANEKTINCTKLRLYAIVLSIVFLSNSHVVESYGSIFFPKLVTKSIWASLINESTKFFEINWPELTLIIKQKVDVKSEVTPAIL